MLRRASARIAIQDIDSRVRPGMTAILNIPVSNADNVLAVPLAAVFTERGERFVFVRNDDEETFERRTIILGVTDYAFAEVVSGLNSGEVVSLDHTINAAAGKASGTTTNKTATPRAAKSNPGGTSAAAAPAALTKPAAKTESTATGQTARPSGS